MISQLFLGLHLLLCLSFQDTGTVRQVMRKHSDGSPYVVLYFNASTQELVKEEVFYVTGKLQWTGTYKNSLEEGIWRYFHENGKLKSEQHYLKGKENGTCTDYDASGKVVKQSVYKNGKLEREMSFN